MSYIKPTVSEFKEYFFRDFPFGTATNTVQDQDIENARTKTTIVINEDLFDSQEAFTVGYQLLTAHNLVTSLRASSQGMNGQYAFLEASKNVGSVSESFSIPQRILDNPSLSMLVKTTYGAMYLEMILPQLVGQIFSVGGETMA